MQAIVAAAIALDAFYSVIQTNVQLPPSLLQQWRTKRASRYSQLLRFYVAAFTSNQREPDCFVITSRKSIACAISRSIRPARLKLL